MRGSLKGNHWGKSHLMPEIIEQRPAFSGKESSMFWTSDTPRTSKREKTQKNKKEDPLPPTRGTVE